MSEDNPQRGRRNKPPKRSDLSAAKAVQEAERKAAILDKFGALDDVDRALLHFRYAHPGIKHEELGALVGLAPLTVTRRLNKEMMKKAWAELMLPVNELLNQAQDSLLRQYLALAQSQDETIRERVLKTLLVSQGIIRVKVDVKGEGFEPLILVTSQQQIVVTRPGTPSSVEPAAAPPIEGVKVDVQVDPH